MIRDDIDHFYSPSLFAQSLVVWWDAMLRETEATALVRGDAKFLRRLRDLLSFCFLINSLRAAECYDTISARTVIETTTDKTTRIKLA